MNSIDESKQLPIFKHKRIIGYLKCDTEDYHFLRNYNIILNGCGYPMFCRNNKTYTIHRFVMKAPQDLVVDHINHNLFDARKCNLRIVTKQINSSNRKSKNNFRGVYKTVHNTWQARVMCKGYRYFLGTFKNELEAKRAAVAKRIELGYLDHGKKPEIN